MTDFFWAKILWYRDFYDVPHIFCISVEGGLLLFDSRFDPAIDDYEPSYRVTHLSGMTVEEGLDPELVISRAQSTVAIGEVHVDRDLFDDSRRERARIPRRIGITDLIESGV